MRAGELLHLARRVAVGRPLRTDAVAGTLLPKRLALPIFSSDALSSVAYASEAALVVLLAASATAGELLIPVSLAIAALLALVVSSYRQIVQAYQSNGGAYVVAKDNLGRLPALVAAGSLLVDYVLTVAVSIAAGVLALTSAVPSLDSVRLELALALLAVIALLNIRGTREAGPVFALPTYVFIAGTATMLIAGAVECAISGCPAASAPDPRPEGAALASVGALVVIRAFASGCTALTGVEAIANGVSAFRPPKARNAARTLATMGVIAVTLFLGVSVMAYETGARPSESVSVLSEVSKAVFPTSGAAAPMFYLLQAATLMVLVLAANAAFQGFPRLTALLADDGFLPLPFANLGERLVYSNGILLLAGAAAVLLIGFDAEVNSLIHLYLVGVFTAFTLSQAGMVRYWRRHSKPGGGGGRVAHRIALNAIGAAATGFVTVLVIATKFTEGAWAVIVAIPLVVYALWASRRRGEALDAELASSAHPRPSGRSPVVVCVHHLDAAAASAAAYARALRGDDFRAIHPVHDPGAAAELRRRWPAFSGSRVELELIDAGDDAAEALARRMLALRPPEPAMLTALLPETFERRTVREMARRSTAFRLRARLFGEPGITVADVLALAPPGEAEPITPPTRSEARVVVAGADQAAARAVAYARTLGTADVKAVYFAVDPERAEVEASAWPALGTGVELEVFEAPFRTLDGPALDAIRSITAEPGSLAVVVIPELVAARWWRDLLLNERSLHLRWLFMLEPKVLLCSVPYALVGSSASSTRPAGGSVDQPAIVPRS